jgi:phospholipase/carboxylesterase
MESGMPSERILLAGFSQGGAISLHTGLTYGKHLAGILALSSYLPTADSIAEEISLVNKDIPIMMAHGTVDPMIPMAHAVQTKQALRRLGYQISWHEYPIMHGVCTEEIQDISAWLLRIFHHEPGV